MSPGTALLLDLDGTLLDTAPDMGGALNLLRREHGLEALPHELIRPVVSQTNCAPDFQLNTAGSGRMPSRSCTSTAAGNRDSPM